VNKCARNVTQNDRRDHSDEIHKCSHVNVVCIFNNVCNCVCMYCTYVKRRFRIQ
jgi:hypothetical protein